MNLNEIRTTVLVSEIEMNARLASCLPAHEAQREKPFFDFLTQLAGQEVDQRVLVMTITEALGRRRSALPINLSRLIDAMVGETGQDVANAAKKHLENIAEIIERKRREHGIITL